METVINFDEWFDKRLPKELFLTLGEALRMGFREIAYDAWEQGREYQEQNRNVGNLGEGYI